MEYTATSFAEPLQRVFDDVLRPEHDVDVTHYRESRYLVDAVSYRLRVPDRSSTASTARSSPGCGPGAGPGRGWPTAACTSTSATASLWCVAR